MLTMYPTVLMLKIAFTSLECSSYFFFFFGCSEISRNSKNLIIVFAQRIYQDKGNFFFPGYANKDIPVHIPVQEYVH